jgi:DNA-binding Lrp family transcriptional regulator
MDELDVKIFRALISESVVSPSNMQVSSSLRTIATRLGADDATVSYRYKRLQDSGCMSAWQLTINPAFFGCSMANVTVEVQPESSKADMIRKLKLLHEVIALSDFYGKALTVLIMYGTDESRSRTVELISRITNAERITQSRMALPKSGTERLTETDLAIIRALSKDARKSAVRVAKELGISTKTVRNRVDRLRRENTIYSLPILNMGSIPGFIPVQLSYTYSSSGAKALVDRAMLSHFDASYLWGGFSDPENGYLMLSAPTMADVQRFLEWAKSQQGIAGARVDIPTDSSMFPEKLIELLEQRDERAAVQRKAFF